MLRDLIEFERAVDAIERIVNATAMPKDPWMTNYVFYREQHKVLLTLSTIMYLFVSGSAVTLLVGIYKKRPACIIQWIYVSVVFISLGLTIEGLQIYSARDDIRNILIVVFVIGDVFLFGKS